MCLRYEGTAGATPVSDRVTGRVSGESDGGAASGVAVSSRAASGVSGKAVDRVVSGSTGRAAHRIVNGLVGETTNRVAGKAAIREPIVSNKTRNNLDMENKTVFPPQDKYSIKPRRILE